MPYGYIHQKRDLRIRIMKLVNLLKQTPQLKRDSKKRANKNLQEKKYENCLKLRYSTDHEKIYPDIYTYPTALNI